MDISFLKEFKLDWRLGGKADRTANDYTHLLELLFNTYAEPALCDAKAWIATTESQACRRRRAQAVRAFGKWAQANDYEFFTWWRQVPLAKEKQQPQNTVAVTDYLTAIKATNNSRDKAVIEVLWSCGLRRNELTKLNLDDINFAEGFLIVRTSKTGRPRVAPLSPAARHALRKHIGKRTQGSVFEMTPNAVRLMLQRLHAPSAHAWRRGWAVQALRSGVSETSVRAAAGWSSGAMVARYTRALSGELAVEEFQRSWQLR